MLHVTHLVSIYGVIMFNSIDFGHRESDGKSHDGCWKGLHSTLLEDV